MSLPKYTIVAAGSKGNVIPFVASGMLRTGNAAGLAFSGADLGKALVMMGGPNGQGYAVCNSPFENPCSDNPQPNYIMPFTGNQVTQQGAFTQTPFTVSEYAMFGNGSSGNWAGMSYAQNVNVLGDGDITIVPYSGGDNGLGMSFDCPTNWNGTPVFESALTPNPQNGVPSGYSNLSAIGGGAVGRYSIGVFFSGGVPGSTTCTIHGANYPWTPVYSAGADWIEWSDWFDIGPAITKLTQVDAYTIAQVSTRLLWSDALAFGAYIERSYNGFNPYTGQPYAWVQVNPKTWGFNVGLQGDFFDDLYSWLPNLQEYGDPTPVAPIYRFRNLGVLSNVPYLSDVTTVTPKPGPPTWR